MGQAIVFRGLPTQTTKNDRLRQIVVNLGRKRYVLNVPIPPERRDEAVAQVVEMPKRRAS